MPPTQGTQLTVDAMALWHNEPASAQQRGGGEGDRERALLPHSPENADTRAAVYTVKGSPLINNS